MGSRTWTIKDLLLVSADYLKQKEIDSPRLTAEVLLARQLQTDRLALYLNFDQPLTEAEVSGFRALVRRRLRREPLHYITGVREFWSLEFMVDPSVLIPRPESEILVEQALARLRAAPEPAGREVRILDLCTGCGALAVSLALEAPGAEIWATDISGDALRVARRNAERHGVAERIRFGEGDLWKGVPDLAFDLILSNPPYVAAETYDDLPPEVRDYEPRLALDGGEKGLRIIRKIFAGAARYLIPGGWLLVEMSPGQTRDALALADAAGAYGETGRIRDYGGLYRVVAAKRM